MEKIMDKEEIKVSHVIKVTLVVIFMVLSLGVIIHLMAEDIRSRGYFFLSESDKLNDNKTFFLQEQIPITSCQIFLDDEAGTYGVAGCKEILRHDNKSYSFESGDLLSYSERGIRILRTRNETVEVKG